MKARNTLTITLIMSILAVTLVSNALPQAQAAPRVDITFTSSGYTNYSGAVMTIAGTTYNTWSLPVTLSLKPGDTYSVSTVSSITDWNSITYAFSSWTNGNGLTTNAGTFTVPSAATTVTANYASTTAKITFSTTGLSNLNSDTILTIDGTAYDYWGIPNISLNWLKGSTHTITATSSITGYDNIKHDFSSWTNGNGLTSNTGTFTTPNTDVLVTANYAVSTTTSHTAHFATSGLSNLGGDVLEIDGTNYTYSNLASISFTWAGGSTHTVRALQPIYNSDTPSKGFNFSSWTNGNGIISASGTFTMPSSDVTVTANYVQSTVQVTFSTSGLSNLNSDTILTIDGTNYDYWAIVNFKAQWMIGSTHTVTAVTSVTGYDSVIHHFSSWTNGNGLTTNVGTFTTPSLDVAVTVNYGTTAPSITITCTNSTVDKGYATIIHGTLLSGTSGISSKTITLSYYNGSAWCSIGSVTTAWDGTYSYTWTVPTSLENGLYPVKATFAGDSIYPTCEATTGSTGNGVSLSVLPESWGSVVALAACFAGAAVFLKVRSKQATKKA